MCECFIFKTSVSAFILLAMFWLNGHVLVTGGRRIARGRNRWPILIILASRRGLSVAGETQDGAFPPREVQACSGGLHAFRCSSRVSAPFSLLPGEESFEVWLPCISLLPSGFGLFRMPLVPVLSLVGLSLSPGALAFALARFAQLKPFPRLSFLFISHWRRLSARAAAASTPRKNTDLLETHRSISAGIPDLFLGCLFVRRAQPCLCSLASKSEMLQVCLELFLSYLLNNQDSCPLFHLHFYHAFLSAARHNIFLSTRIS